MARHFEKKDCSFKYIFQVAYPLVIKGFTNSTHLIEQSLKKALTYYCGWAFIDIQYYSSSFFVLFVFGLLGIFFAFGLVGLITLGAERSVFDFSQLLL